MTAHKTQSNETRRRGRRGFIASMELVLALPVLFVVILAGIQFSLLFLARGDVLEASRAGCRIACQPGVHPEVVRERVLEVLEPRLRHVADVHVETAEYPGDVVTVAVRVPMRVASPDLLWPIGIGLGDGHLHASTRMTSE